MATEDEAETSGGEPIPDATDRRRSPLAKHVPLWVGFLVVIAIAIVTVLVPEMTDEGDEEDPDGAPAAGVEDDHGDDEGGGGASAGAAAPASRGAPAAPPSPAGASSP